MRISIRLFNIRIETLKEGDGHGKVLKELFLDVIPGKAHLLDVNGVRYEVGNVVWRCDHDPVYVEVWVK